MKYHNLIASSIGNILEWYDFALFTYCGTLFSDLVFPTHNHTTALIALFSVFALGFVCRPLGAIFFGHLGDRIGRSTALRWSVILISIPTFLMSLLPTYHQVGIISPILLVIIRLIQGMCIGGEYSGTIIYLAETAPTKNKAFFTSFAATGANAGLFVGVGMTAILEHVLTKAQLHDFGWRIAFFIGGLLGLLIFYLRRFLIETPGFIALVRAKKTAKIPLFTACKEDLLIMAKIIAIVSFGATLFYITFTYLAFYLSQFSHCTFKEVTYFQTIFIGGMFLLVPLSGLLCDTIVKKKMYYFLCGIGLFSSVIVFYFFRNGGEFSILAGISLLTIISSMEQATTLITVAELVPIKVRYTSLAIAYNIGNMMFGGFTPLFLTSLIHISHNDYMPAFYLMITAPLTLIVIIFSI